MEFKDYCKSLGVDRTTSDEPIKKAFRRLARKHHPDINKAPDAAERRQDLNEAHDVLRDPEKRAPYDQTEAGAHDGQDLRPPPGWNSGFEFSGSPDAFADGADHSAFFEALFGAGRYGASGARAAQGATRHEHATTTRKSSCLWRTLLSVPHARCRCKAPCSTPVGMSRCNSGHCR